MKLKLWHLSLFCESLEIRPWTEKTDDEQREILSWSISIVVNDLNMKVIDCEDGRFVIVGMFAQRLAAPADYNLYASRVAREDLYGQAVLVDTKSRKPPFKQADFYDDALSFYDPQWSKRWISKLVKHGQAKDLGLDPKLEDC